MKQRPKNDPKPAKMLPPDPKSGAVYAEWSKGKKAFPHALVLAYSPKTGGYAAYGGDAEKLADMWTTLPICDASESDGKGMPIPYAQIPNSNLAAFVGRFVVERMGVVILAPDATVIIQCEPVQGGKTNGAAGEVRGRS